jgi:hypothetical protein
MGQLVLGKHWSKLEEGSRRTEQALESEEEHLELCIWQVKQVWLNHLSAAGCSCPRRFSTKMAWGHLPSEKEAAGNSESSQTLSGLQNLSVSILN